MLLLFLLRQVGSSMSRVYFISLIIVLLLVACGPSDTTSQDTPNKNIESTNPVSTHTGLSAEPAYPIESSESGYPATETLTEEQTGYPADDSINGNVEAAYPAQGRTVNETKRFSFEGVISSGQEEITGAGYPNTPIKIISISHAGEVLGYGSTDESGNFSILLQRAVDKGELIGVLLGEDSQAEIFLDAPGSDIPMIGFVLAQQLVK